MLETRKTKSGSLAVVDNIDSQSRQIGDLSSMLLQDPLSRERNGLDNQQNPLNTMSSLPTYENRIEVFRRLFQAAKVDTKLKSALNKRTLEGEDRDYVVLFAIRESLLMQAEVILDANYDHTQYNGLTSLGQELDTALTKKANEISIEASIHKKELGGFAQRFLDAKKNIQTRFKLSRAKIFDRTAINLVKKERNKAKRIISELKSLRFENLNDTVKTLAEKALLLNGAQSKKDGVKADFSTFVQVESSPWWNWMSEIMRYEEVNFSDEWNKKRNIALDIEVKKSLGSVGGLGIGYILDLLGDVEAVSKRGQKIINKALKTLPGTKTNYELNPGRRFEIHQERQKLESLLLSAKLNRAFVGTVKYENTDDSIEKRKQELAEFNKRHPVGLASNAKEFFTSLAEAKSEFATKITKLDDPTDCEKILLWADALSKSGLACPKPLARVVERINLVSKRKDKTSDWEKRLKVVNLLRATMILAPNLGQIVGETLQVIHEKADDRAWHDRVSWYPEDKQEALLRLRSVENVDYMGGVEMLSSAIELYYKQAGADAPQVFWQRHPDYINMDELTELFSASILKGGDFNYDFIYTLPKNIRDLYRFADNGITEGYKTLAEVYQAVHPEFQNVNQTKIEYYFADYFSFLMSKHIDIKDQVASTELLSYALAKNDGDMHAALWDVAFVSEILTRYWPSNAHSIDGKISGWLAIKLLDDPYAKGYTAEDLANVLPDREFWDIYYPQEGNKDVDPANFSGEGYHLKLITAFLGEVPSSAALAGLMSEWLMGSNGVYQHGEVKLWNQVEWLLSHAQGMETFLEQLPDHQSNVSPENTSEQINYFVPLDTVSLGQLHNINAGKLWESLAQGKVVTFQAENGQDIYVALGGSVASPYVRLVDKPETLSEPISFQSMTIFQDFSPEQLDHYSVVENTEYSALNLKSNLTDEQIKEYILMSTGPEGVQLISYIIPEYSYSKALNELVRDGFTEPIIASLEDYAPFLSLDSWSVLIKEYSPCIRLANEYIPTQQLLEIVRAQYPKLWASLVISYGDIFIEVISKDDLNSLILASGASELSLYFSFWNSIWTAEELYTAILEYSPNGYATIMKYPELYFQFVHKDQLKEIIETKAYPELISSFEDGWNRLWTREEIEATMQSMYPNDWEDILYYAGW